MEFIIIILLIAVNGVLALAEMAFVSASVSKLKLLTAERKDAHYIIALRKEPDKFLSTIQVGITLVGIVSGTVSGLTMADDLSRLIVKLPFVSHLAYPIALIFLVLIVTYLTIVFGELVPKTLALRYPEILIVRLAGFVRFCTFVFYPLVFILSSSVKLFYLLSGIKTPGEDRKIDLVKQIISSTRIAVAEKKIEKEQEQIIRKAVAINKVMLREIMVEKKDMKYLRTDMTLMDALLEAHSHQHTRYPVVDPQKQKTVGYINFKDIINVLKFNPREPSIHSICRPVIQFPSEETIMNALKTMTKNFQHIALVVDPKNNDVGLVTLEDIVETLVGDIRDEYDFIPDYLYKIADHRFIAGGKVYLSVLHKRVSHLVPRLNVTLNDWLVGYFGDDLKIDARVTVDEIIYVIKKLSRSKIYEVIIEKPKH